MDEETIMKLGHLLQPMFEHLPPIPVHQWHRLSFDIVQLSDSIQVSHIRFAPITHSASPNVSTKGE